MDKIIVYFPYSLREINSGSAVRPQKMLIAFQEYAALNNLDLIEIYGESDERQRKIASLLQTVNPKEILFCYMENSTLPLWLTDKDHIPRKPLLEIKLFRYFRKNKIPFGLFYRDIYWAFDDEYPLKGIKKVMMKSIFNLELKLYKKYVDMLFLPSESMNKYVGFDKKRISELPPGGEVRFLTKTNHSQKVLKVIYVGAISEKMGLFNMINAIQIVNSAEFKCKLLIVCRANDYAQYKDDLSKFEKKGIIEVRQAFGEELYNLYKDVDIAIIPREKNLYNDFAVPVKLFEYLSFGLPVISTDNNAVVKIINQGPYGIITDSNAEELAKAIIKLNSSSLRTEIRDNIENDLPKRHLWINRVRQIHEELCEN